MTASRGVFVASVCAVLIAACGQFSASPAATDGGAAEGGVAEGGVAEGGVEPVGCPPQTCAGRPGCVMWSFDSNTCDPFEFGGDPAGQTLRDCANGNLHIAAADTLDLVASATLDTPTSPYSAVHVAFRLSVADWDGDPAVAIKLGGTTLATMRIDDFAGTMKTSFCRSEPTDCPGDRTADFPPNTEHAFLFEIDTATTRLSVDCVEVGSFPTLGPLITDALLELRLGHVDARPFDGTFDDVLVWFKP